METIQERIRAMNKKQKIILACFLILVIFSMGFVTGVEYSKNKCYRACLEWSCENHDALVHLCSRMNPTLTIGNMTFNLSGVNG